MPVGIAYVGCGFVADFYQSCLPNAGGALDVRGCFDIDPARRRQFAAFHKVHAYSGLEDILNDPTVSIVINLTNPVAHFDVSKKCLTAGKHVYTEKPLALDLGEAGDLVRIATERGLHIAAAPSSVLGEAAQTLWRAVRDGKIGRPRLVYAEIDDGMVHRIGCENWRSVSGAPWPAVDEFRTGCTLEHAGYALSWLAAMFGPVQRVTSFASTLIADKGHYSSPDYEMAPDFSVGCLEFDDGVVVRLTNSIIAPHDHTMRVFGEGGELRVNDIWDFSSTVTHRPILGTRVRRFIEKKTGLRPVKTITPARKMRLSTAANGAKMDFMRGVSELADAVSSGRTPRLAGDFALHITEVSLALQHPEIFGANYRVSTTFAPMAPMPWAL